MAQVVLRDLVKTYGTVYAVHDVSLTVNDGENQKPERVFRAAQIRDEHYDNEAYKDRLRRNNNLRFAIILSILLIALLGLSWTTMLSPPTEPTMLLSVGIFGLLGATISATIATSNPLGSTRSPRWFHQFTLLFSACSLGQLRLSCSTLSFVQSSTDTHLNSAPMTPTLS